MLPPAAAAAQRGSAEPTRRARRGPAGARPVRGARRGPGAGRVAPGLWGPGAGSALPGVARCSRELGPAVWAGSVGPVPRWAQGTAPNSAGITCLAVRLCVSPLLKTSRRCKEWQSSLKEERRRSCHLCQKIRARSAREWRLCGQWHSTGEPRCSETGACHRRGGGEELSSLSGF